MPVAWPRSPCASRTVETAASTPAIGSSSSASAPRAGRTTTSGRGLRTTGSTIPTNPRTPTGSRSTRHWPLPHAAGPRATRRRTGPAPRRFPPGRPASTWRRICVTRGNWTSRGWRGTRGRGSRSPRSGSPWISRWTPSARWWRSPPACAPACGVEDRRAISKRPIGWTRGSTIACSHPLPDGGAISAMTSIPPIPGSPTVRTGSRSASTRRHRPRRPGTRLGSRGGNCATPAASSPSPTRWSSPTTAPQAGTPSARSPRSATRPRGASSSST